MVRPVPATGVRNGGIEWHARQLHAGRSARPFGSADPPFHLPARRGARPFRSADPPFHLYRSRCAKPPFGRDQRPFSTTIPQRSELHACRPGQARERRARSQGYSAVGVLGFQSGWNRIT
jgi:hypothetical protein